MSPKPFTRNDPREYSTNRDDLEWCVDCQRFYWRDHGGHHCNPKPGTSWNTVICTAVIIVCAILAGWLLSGTAHARTLHAPAPIQRPVGLLQAKHQCAHSTPRVECRAALRRALAAVAWQKQEVQRVLEHTRGKQPFAYAAHLAELACHSFAAERSRCRPALEMLNVGRCESGLQTADPNPSSTALGWTQWLTGTWNAHPAGQQGWSRLDVLAMGIATEALVYHDHGWHEWSCGWAAS